MSESQPIDETTPGEKWDFDADVAHVFVDMLRRSIPDYDVMRGAVRDIGFEFRRPSTSIVDLGCSRGDALAPFVERYADENTYIGVDVSEPMLAVARKRFAASSTTTIEHCDLRSDYPLKEKYRTGLSLPAIRRVRYSQASVTLAVLVLQFTPIEYRQKILRNIYNSTCDGGALIVVEKILGASADLDDLFVKLYYKMKSDNGYSPEQIKRKRLSLEGVLVPQTASANAAMLHDAGFRQVDTFWRFLNFAGWIAVR